MVLVDVGVRQLAVIWRQQSAPLLMVDTETLSKPILGRCHLASYLYVKKLTSCRYSYFPVFTIITTQLVRRRLGAPTQLCAQLRTDVLTGTLLSTPLFLGYNSRHS